MDIFTVNEETCTRCGICAEVCIVSVIDISDDFPKPVSFAETSCIRCGACVISCPSASFLHRDISLDECPIITNNHDISFEQVEVLLKTRRSVRVFKDQLVPREDIEKILEVVRYSPTGTNLQNVQWLVFDDKAELEHLNRIGVDWMVNSFINDEVYANLVSEEWVENLVKRKETGQLSFLKGAPVVISAVSDLNRPESKYTNCAIALSYFDALAQTMGLGCCWHGFFTRASTDSPEIAKMINLPEGFQIYGSLLVGYPRYEYKRIPKRNPAKITWHSDN